MRTHTYIHTPEINLLSQSCNKKKNCMTSSFLVNLRHLESHQNKTYFSIFLIQFIDFSNYSIPIMLLWRNRGPTLIKLIQIYVYVLLVLKSRNVLKQELFAINYVKGNTFYMPTFRNAIRILFALGMRRPDASHSVQKLIFR